MTKSAYSLNSYWFSALSIFSSPDTVLVCLNAAYAMERLDVLRLLLDAGASLERNNWNGQTPLLVAIARGNIPAVEQLIERGADTMARNEERATPLHVALAYR
jgi:ankyrin repeat protein